MGMLKFEVPHSLTKVEAKKRIEALLAYWSGKYGMRCEWNGDGAKISGKAVGVTIDAHLTVTDHIVGGEARDPGLLLRGQATKYLRTKLADFLDPKKSSGDVA